MERDTRDELYISLLGKDQTFHGRQRIGDIMARATNDVRMLNIMFSPGVMLIVDGFMGIVRPSYSLPSSTPNSCSSLFSTCCSTPSPSGTTPAGSTRSAKPCANSSAT
jgi:ABC-type multidrug transport system fused ATPase/permease subunit